MPSWDLFEAQPQSYRDEVLPPRVTARLAVELGVAQGWDRYVGDARRHARRRPFRRLGARRGAARRSTASRSTTSSRAPGGSLPPDDVARCTRRRSDGPDVPGARRQGAVWRKARCAACSADSFEYFVKEVDPGNGLILDKTAPDWPASIAATAWA